MNSVTFEREVVVGYDDRSVCSDFISEEREPPKTILTRGRYFQYLER